MITIISIRWSEEVGYRDWRDRLRRNLARPSVGRWEPLTRWTPNAFFFDGKLIAHPKVVAALIER